MTSPLPSKPASPIPVSLLDRDNRGIWHARAATARELRDRTTVAARRAITQAAARGLKTEIFSDARTEITGGFGHKLVITHRRLPDQPRVTRFLLARLDGAILETFDAARATGWIAAQPRADRCHVVMPCAAGSVAGPAAGSDSSGAMPRRARVRRASAPASGRLSVVR